MPLDKKRLERQKAHVPDIQNANVRLEEPLQKKTRYSVDEIRSLIQDLHSQDEGRKEHAALELIKNYNDIGVVAAKVPEINVTEINKQLNQVITEHTPQIIDHLEQQGAGEGIDFLANSAVISDNAVKETARSRGSGFARGAVVEKTKMHEAQKTEVSEDYWEKSSIQSREEVVGTTAITGQEERLKPEEPESVFQKQGRPYTIGEGRYSVGYEGVGWGSPGNDPSMLEVYRSKPVKRVSDVGMEHEALENPWVAARRNEAEETAYQYSIEVPPIQTPRAYAEDVSLQDGTGTTLIPVGIAQALTPSLAPEDTVPQYVTMTAGQLPGIEHLATDNENQDIVVAINTAPYTYIPVSIVGLPAAARAEMKYAANTDENVQKTRAQGNGRTGVIIAPLEIRQEQAQAGGGESAAVVPVISMQVPQTKEELQAIRLGVAQKDEMERTVPYGVPIEHPVSEGQGGGPPDSIELPKQAPLRGRQADGTMEPMKNVGIKLARTSQVGYYPDFGGEKTREAEYVAEGKVGIQRAEEIQKEEGAIENKERGGMAEKQRSTEGMPPDEQVQKGQDIEKTRESEETIKKVKEAERKDDVHIVRSTSAPLVEEKKGEEIKREEPALQKEGLREEEEEQIKAIVRKTRKKIKALDETDVPWYLIPFVGAYVLKKKLDAQKEKKPAKTVFQKCCERCHPFYTVTRRPHRCHISIMFRTFIKKYGKMN